METKIRSKRERCSADCIVFSSPSTTPQLQVYLNFTGSHEERHSTDLGALRLLSTHSIINPWVFIILRPSVLKNIWRKLHKQQKTTVMLGKTLNTQTRQTGETGETPCCAAPEPQVWRWKRILSVKDYTQLMVPPQHSLIKGSPTLTWSCWIHRKHICHVKQPMIDKPRAITKNRLHYV